MNSRPMRRSSRLRSTKIRKSIPQFVCLEARELLSTLPVSQPMFQVGALVQNSSPPSGAYTPAQIKQAYQYSNVSFNGVAGDGSGQTIAIVDAYNDPNIQADLNAFDTKFGLPNTTVSVVNESGGSTLPGTDSSGGWELEESLDVEWAHAMAPGAKILLVEASSPSDSDLLPAVSYAAQHANVVSMSWGGGEFSGETSYDSYFNKSGVAFVASSGDNGAPISWPAASPNVLAVGGTALTLSGGNYASESGWSGSGGGPSAYVTQPTYQKGVVTATSMRANPDVAYDASPSTGYAVYDSFTYNGTSYGWIQLGGTSAGAPQWAAILAIADQGRAANNQAALNSASAQEVMTTLYKNPGNFHDVTTGGSTGSPSYGATAGYDYVTGLGTPMVNRVIGSLDGTAVTSPTPTPTDTIAVKAPTTATAGTSFSYTITADKSSGGVDTGYTGTVRLSGTDAKMLGLPSSYTFTAADAGTHTFTVTLKTAGSQKITETDYSGASTTSTIAVSPASASQFVLSGVPSSVNAGTTQTLKVTAEDAYGNVATGFTGTVTFSSSDKSATLPGSYTFTTADKGVHSFSLKFATAGTQTLTVSASGFSATQSGIKVAPAAPISLTATAASASQINLTWTAPAGATGYQIQRSPNGTSGWTQIGTATGTSYSDTGLAAGTTYYYRVIATGGGYTSAASNTATATTTGTPVSSPGVTDSFWGNSYTPYIDSYGSGNYELGMQFTTSQAGEVTGVRFYKESWMGGATHVGHLWASNGTLLASATFTGETASGWQQVNFSHPVIVQPGTIYVVSFSTGGGYFATDSTYFDYGGVTNGPLSAPSDYAYGGNGLYQTAGGSFPNQDSGGMNFWVDVAFTPTSSASVQPAAVALTSSGGAGYFVATTPASGTPTGPMGVVPSANGSRASSRWTSTGSTTTAHRGSVNQARSTTSWGSRWGWFPG